MLLFIVVMPQLTLAKPVLGPASVKAWPKLHPTTLGFLLIVVSSLIILEILPGRKWSASGGSKGCAAIRAIRRVLHPWPLEALLLEGMPLAKLYVLDLPTAHVLTFSSDAQLR
jgi:hypothetical protein